MKNITLAFGREDLRVGVPDDADVLAGRPLPPLARPGAVIAGALAEPIGTPGLREMAEGKGSAAVVVSDNTRPVPYRGEAGILRPILAALKEAQVADIKVIVATGTHRSMTDEELRAMLDEAAFGPGVRVLNHVCTDQDMLRKIGSTPNTPEVTVNRHYLDAELKIVTGLVEPHFMAGYSGGRKAVCPGICGRSVTYGFHSARMLDHERAASLVLEGNPCHEESLAVARMAGVDFSVNVTIDHEKRLLGVFAGEMESAHRAAVAHCDEFAVIPLSQRYDIVITHSGHVGMNHYQCGKAGTEAARAVKPGGAVIMAANLGDKHPLGSEDYQRVLAQLAADGWEGFRRRIFGAEWPFTPDQWGPQMWGKVFAVMGGPQSFYTCAPRLAGFGPEQVPENNVARNCGRRGAESEAAWAERMVQETLAGLLAAKPGARVLVLPDGPYAVPQVRA